MSLLALLATVLPHVPWNQIEPLAEHVVDGKATEQELVDAIPPLLDAAIPFDVVLPGPIGMALEAADGPVFHALAVAIAGLATHRVKVKRAAASGPHGGFLGLFKKKAVQPAG